MKRKYLFAVACAVVTLAFILEGTGVFHVTSAQGGRAQRDPGASRPAQGDDHLAALLKRLTNRSTDQLVQRPAANVHGVSMDLGDGFQNVMLARQGTDGQPLTECVTSLAEANDFLGRDLETGAPIYSQRAERDEIDQAAALHGMPRDEYLFYKRLIDQAAAQRAASPNAATLTIVNADGAGEGFNDPTAVTPEGGNTGITRGGQRLQLFQFAAGIWGAFLDSSVEIKINSQFNSLTPCTPAGGVLGSAGTTQIFRDFDGALDQGTWYHASLANKLAGGDLNPALPEINATFNSDVDTGCLGGGSRFYYGLDNSTPPLRVNLLIVLLHEMGHGLGFSSFVNGQTGALAGGFPDAFLLRMFDRTTSKFWVEMTNAERQASALNAGNVVLDGANLRSASGFLINGRDPEGRVQLHTPGTFAPGSSISHFGTANFPDLLMEPNISVGLPLDLDLTKQVMRDSGWFRDSDADLKPDTITAVNLSGNAVIGQPVTVGWTNNGGFNRNVTIELSTDGGTTYPTALATGTTNNGSFTFTVPNTPTTQGRIRVREAGFVDLVGSSANFTIATTFVTRTPFDYDGDGKADISVYRPSASSWFLLNSSTGFSGTTFGTPSDLIAPADFDGDGKTDIAVFRPSSGSWFWLNSGTGTLGAATFGTNGDLPVPGDFDGDGKADISVWRQSDGGWYRLNSSNGAFVATAFGTQGDKPVLGDFDGDGKTDLAVYRSSGGAWYRLNSGDGSFVALSFGISEDLPAVGDFDGDHKTDISVFRPSTGSWFRLNSGDGAFVGVAFGANGDRPAAADYDGDGKTDIGVFRPAQGVWYQLKSTSGFAATQFGSNGDYPTPGAFVF